MSTVGKRGSISGWRIEDRALLVHGLVHRRGERTDQVHVFGELCAVRDRSNNGSARAGKSQGDPLAIGMLGELCHQALAGRDKAVFLCRRSDKRQSEATAMGGVTGSLITSTGHTLTQARRAPLQLAHRAAHQALVALHLQRNRAARGRSVRRRVESAAARAWRWLVHRSQSSGKRASGGGPSKLPRIHEEARFCRLAKPGFVYRRDHDRAGSLPRNAVESRGRRQDRPQAATLARQPRARRPGRRQPGLRLSWRDPGYLSHRPKLGEYRRWVESKLSTIVHGTILLISIAFLPHWLNAIPLSCLAAILLVTGFKLASPALFRKMKSEGRYQFAPFLATVVAIVFTDLLSGVLVGLSVALAFILTSNFRMPIRKIVETHLGREVVHIELADQVSFLNRAALSRELDRVPEGGQVLLDARTTDYIDPDVLDLIHDYKDRTAPARRVGLSLIGFHERYELLEDGAQHVDYSSRELQETLTPEQVLEILMEGHARFRAGRRITRDLARQSSPITETQAPLAVVVSCIDSRAPVELIFDLGLGDIFSVRVAGNITGPTVLGSVEYACAVASARLVLVLGHTRCGAVTSAVELRSAGADPDQVAGCESLGHIVRAIDQAITPEALSAFEQMPTEQREAFVDEVSRRNVLSVVETLPTRSKALRRLSEEHRILIVGAIYDVVSREIEFLTATSDALAAKS